MAGGAFSSNRGETMAEPVKKPGNQEKIADAQEREAQRRGFGPTETHGMERAPQRPTLGEQIRAHANRPHKGDVGRPGTNEEVYQGSKERELK
jgi:hypothetical protein